MPLKPFKKRFGDIAKEKGYITDAQLAEALEQQQHLLKGETRSRLIGSVLYRQGVMDIWQVIDVLKCLENENISPEKEKRPCK